MTSWVDIEAADRSESLFNICYQGIFRDRLQKIFFDSTLPGAWHSLKVWSLYDDLDYWPIIFTAREINSLGK